MNAFGRIIIHACRWMQMTDFADDLLSSDQELGGEERGLG